MNRLFSDWFFRAQQSKNDKNSILSQQGQKKQKGQQSKDKLASNKNEFQLMGNNSNDIKNFENIIRAIPNICSFLTRHDTISVSNASFKILKCCTGGQFIKDDFLFSNAITKKYEKCCFSICQKLNSQMIDQQSEVSHKKSSQQSNKLSIIIFQLSEQGKNDTKILHIDDSIVSFLSSSVGNIKQSIRNKLQKSFLEQVKQFEFLENRQVKYVFKSLEDFYSIKFFLCDIVNSLLQKQYDKAPCKMIRQEQQQIVQKNDQIQQLMNNEENINSYQNGQNLQQEKSMNNQQDYSNQNEVILQQENKSIVYYTQNSIKSLSSLLQQKSLNDHPILFPVEISIQKKIHSRTQNIPLIHVSSTQQKQNKINISNIFKDKSQHKQFQQNFSIVQKTFKKQISIVYQTQEIKTQNGTLTNNQNQQKKKQQSQEYIITAQDLENQLSKQIRQQKIDKLSMLSHFQEQKLEQKQFINQNFQSQSLSKKQSYQLFQKQQQQNSQKFNKLQQNLIIFTNNVSQMQTTLNTHDNCHLQPVPLNIQQKNDSKQSHALKPIRLNFQKVKQPEYSQLSPDMLKRIQKSKEQQEDFLQNFKMQEQEKQEEQIKEYHPQLKQEKKGLEQERENKVLEDEENTKMNNEMKPLQEKAKDIQEHIEKVSRQFQTNMKNKELLMQLFTQNKQQIKSMILIQKNPLNTKNNKSTKKKSKSKGKSKLNLSSSQQKTYNIFCLVQDHQSQSLKIQIHKQQKQSSKFTLQKSLDVFSNKKQNNLSTNKSVKKLNLKKQKFYYKQFNSIEVNQNLENKVLLYSTEISSKNPIIAEYDLKAGEIVNQYKIPSLYNSFDSTSKKKNTKNLSKNIFLPFKQVKYQFQDSSQTFFTLNKKQICLFDKRIQSHHQSHIFSYKDSLYQKNNESLNFDCFDIHKNGYGIVTGVSGQSVKIFDIRKSGIVSKNVIQLSAMTKHKNERLSKQLTPLKNISSNKTKTIQKSHLKTQVKKIPSTQSMSQFHLLRALNSYDIHNQQNILDISNKKPYSPINDLEYPSKFKQIKILYNENMQANQIFTYLQNGEVYLIDCIEGQNLELNSFENCLRSQNRSLVRKIDVNQQSSEGRNTWRIDSKGEKIFRFDNQSICQIQLKENSLEIESQNYRLKENLQKEPKFYDFLNTKEIVYEYKGEFHIFEM